MQYIFQVHGRLQYLKGYVAFKLRILVLKKPLDYYDLHKDPLELCGLPFTV